MTFTLEVLHTMESIEKTGRCGLDKRGMVLEILEELICSRYGHEVWETKYKGYAEDLIEFIIAVSKKEIKLDINKKIGMLFPCC